MPPPALLTARGGMRGPLPWTTGITAIYAAKGVIFTRRSGGQYSTPIDSDKVGFGSLLLGTGVFAIGCVLGAVAPSYWLFAGALIVIGIAALTFTNATNSLMQLSTEPSMRGRVMALRIGIALGGTPIGAPIVGWVADRFGPRWALAVGAASGFAAAAVAAAYLIQQRRHSSPPA